MKKILYQKIIDSLQLVGIIVKETANLSSGQKIHPLCKSNSAHYSKGLPFLATIVQKSDIHHNHTYTKSKLITLNNINTKPSKNGIRKTYKEDQRFYKCKSCKLHFSHYMMMKHKCKLY